MIRALIGVVAALVLAGLGWTGWWFAAASGQEAAIDAWLEDRRARGWLAEAEVAIQGFPTRFERRLEGLELVDPRAGWAWNAPRLDVGSDAWDPTYLAIAFPNEQTLAVPGERLRIEAERLAAVAAVVPSLSLQLREVSVEADDLRLAATAGWQTGAERVRMAVTRRTDDSAPDNTYDIRLQAQGVSLPGFLGRALTPADAAEPPLGVLDATGMVVTDRPVDRDALERGDIGAETVVVRRGTLTYGRIAFLVDGRLDADAAGFAEGSVDIEARDWKRLLEGLVASGTLNPNVAEGIRGALRIVTLFNSGDDLALTLSFAEGRTLLGPVAIGEAPRMKPR
ncbi:MAG: DUF2125 domain-containing protein [Pseudomonadota bacterium]